MSKSFLTNPSIVNRSLWKHPAPWILTVSRELDCYIRKIRRKVGGVGQAAIMTNTLRKDRVVQCRRGSVKNLWETCRTGYADVKLGVKLREFSVFLFYFHEMLFADRDSKTKHGTLPAGQRHSCYSQQQGQRVKVPSTTNHSGCYLHCTPFNQSLYALQLTVTSKDSS